MKTVYEAWIECRCKKGSMYLLAPDAFTAGWNAAMKEALVELADRTYVPPGTTVYRIRDDGMIQASRRWTATDANFGRLSYMIQFRGVVHEEGQLPNSCYSTRANAEADKSARWIQE